MSASGSRIHVRTTHLPIHSSNLHSSLFFFFCFFLPSSFFIPYSLFPFRLPHQIPLALPFKFKPSNYTLTQPTHHQKSLNILHAKPSANWPSYTPLLHTYLIVFTVPEISLSVLRRLDRATHDTGTLDVQYTTSPLHTHVYT